MSTGRSTLAARHADLAQGLILEAAVQLMVDAPGEPLSVRATAKLAEVSERTVFRYFATRDDLLSATAREFQRRLDLPEAPTSLEGLLAYPSALYAAFEAQGGLIRAALPSEISDRLRQWASHGRRQSLSDLIDRLAPDRPSDERGVATANIYYHLVATTWHYYRFHIDFQPSEAIRAAETIVVDTLRGLGVDCGRI